MSDIRIGFTKDIIILNQIQRQRLLERIEEEKDEDIKS
jgi:hypothetical protein